MKIKNKVLSVIGLCLIFSPTIKADNISYQSQIPATLSEEEVKSLLNQDKIDHEKEEKEKNFNLSLAEYIRNEYNSSDFAEYFAQDGCHLIELLRIIKAIDFGEDNIIQSFTIFKLFNDKIKACDLIDHTVLHQIIQPLPQILGSYFKEDKTNYVESLKKQLELMIVAKLDKHLIMEEPNIELLPLDLAEVFLNVHQNESDKQNDKNKLKGIVVRFLENALGKTIWSSIYYQGSWESFTTLGHLIKELEKTKIIDDEDDIDSLLWSLVHRFNFFLDISGAALPMEFFEEIEDDLGRCLVPFLEEEEQDDFIKTKKETLLEGLLKAKTKALAFEKAGIIS